MATSQLAPRLASHLARQAISTVPRTGLVPPHALRTRIALNQSRTWSSTSKHLEAPKLPSDKANQRSGNPSVGAFSFRDLGASRPVKIVVWSAIGIIGTAETIFWARWLKAYFSAAPADGGRKDE